MNDLKNSALRTTGFAYRKAKDIHKPLVAILILAPIIILIMWGINVLGGMVLNTIPLLLITLALIVFMSRPKIVFTVMGLGGLVAELRDEDITQGSLQGIHALYRVTLGVLFWFFLVGVLLTVIPFGKAPSVFFPLAELAGLAGLATAYFKVQSKRIVYWLIIAGCSVTALYYTDKLIPESWVEPPSSESTMSAPVSKWPKPLILNKGEESRVQYVRRTECIDVWGKDPDGDAFTVFVRGRNQSEWLQWETYLEKKRNHELSYEFPTFFKFRGNHDNSLVYFEITRRIGVCT